MSLLGTIFLATSPLLFDHSFMAYTNLGYTILGTIGFIYLWLWWNDFRIQHVLLGGIFIGLSTWVRSSEPFYMGALILIGLGLLQQLKLKIISPKSVVAMLIAAVFAWYTRFPWDSLITSLYSQNLGAPINSLVLVSTWSPMAFIGRSREVAIYLWHYSVSVYLCYALIALGVGIVDLRHKRWEILFPWFTMCMFLGLIFIGTLLLSFSLESWNRIGDSVARLSMFLIPLWIYMITTSGSWLHTRKKYVAKT